MKQDYCVNNKNKQKGRMSLIDFIDLRSVKIITMQVTEIKAKEAPNNIERTLSTASMMESAISCSIVPGTIKMIIVVLATRM